jgi:hypothetical protein
MLVLAAVMSSCGQFRSCVIALCVSDIVWENSSVAVLQCVSQYSDWPCTRYLPSRMVILNNVFRGFVSMSVEILALMYAVLKDDHFCFSSNTLQSSSCSRVYKLCSYLVWLTKLRRPCMWSQSPLVQENTCTEHVGNY